LASALRSMPPQSGDELLKAVGCGYNPRRYPRIGTTFTDRPSTSAVT
jgi:hypothetical protein